MTPEASAMRWNESEASLEELLADPMIELVLSADGLTMDDLRRILEAARVRLRASTAPGRGPG